MPPEPSISATPTAATFVRGVFDTIAGHLVDRLDTIALFASKPASFEAWCVWEAVAAIEGASGETSCTPAPTYASLGVTGSRDAADLLVTETAHGEGVVVEIALIQDASRHAGIDRLDTDRQRLAKPRTTAQKSLQIIIVAAPDVAVDGNPHWRQWLGMAKVSRREADHVRLAPLGECGQLAVYGWVG